MARAPRTKIATKTFRLVEVELRGLEPLTPCLQNFKQHYRNLRVFFKWLAREGERQAPDPMPRVDAPMVARRVAKPILPDGDLEKLLKACGGQDFEARRDTAILRILIDSGVRVSGLAGIHLIRKSESYRARGSARRSVSGAGFGCWRVVRRLVRG